MVEASLATRNTMTMAVRELALSCQVWCLLAVPALHRLAQVVRAPNSLPTSTLILAYLGAKRVIQVAHVPT